jgi:hypothetical protein
MEDIEMTDQTHSSARQARPKTALAAQSAVNEQPRIAAHINKGVVMRAAIVALTLGTALTLVNQPGAIFDDGAVQILPLVLVYLTPFLVVALS